ncbi:MULTISPECIES: bifunctional phosphopantothenoylcysteine decarboxylase/phosphopantothenate--cysteine ligase CoaBC [Rhodanobacter]|uniref:bifunctional phosphopantothenoylcysteine decarboxylase/phosphopantothenate--cysteine ligase CoaBC n=1 Tax=Rhodanobacter TaxID=75309 RepID=UPI0004813506|nr:MULTISPECIES: bifunctional phosphopantothenoylcysteine decarboxylase/phosphopantothenate--cysteine ligase CoaBC [Rhodanobacter]TAN17810.1 MAG: bifunctional phosphopantothenoylcysteine decarboxylase/phosphopantothenate--cysteine ligase CoaBC [Rhodanobacter sp.]UJJ54783.1 bifunctional phosphopantothenoylcysteine decarboxylase/phosphopantothenate--cysteine ligase CoaBC [Rhodanobacter thiooxydans]
MSLAQRRILLGVSGGIAAYKSCELVRRLRDLGAQVRVVMTEGATRFVSPTTFQALSGQPVRISLWDAQAEAAMGHIELARWAERILVAPASADLLARLAHGLADDLLTTLCLASAAPLYLAPAMNQQMWAHPAVQANLTMLRRHGAQILGPAVGDQACGDVGSGRMLEPHELRDALVASFGERELAGLRVLISAGPTYEDIDPVRFIGNRSSGKMGFAVAEAAAQAGAEVSLVAGPVSLATPPGVAQRIDVRSAAQMHAAVLHAAAQADIYIGAAAVGDYRPQEVATRKLKKHDGGELVLRLTENPDILATLSAQTAHPFLVGFAAETHDVASYAQGKLRHKGLDMIAANQVGGGLGFEAADNALTLYWADGAVELPRAEKSELARQLVARVAERYRATRG